MKSDEKDTPVGPRSAGKDGRLERQEREAAALRANLRRRKDQQKARQAKVPAEPDSPAKDER